MRLKSPLSYQRECTKTCSYAPLCIVAYSYKIPFSAQRYKKKSHICKDMREIFTFFLVFIYFYSFSFKNRLPSPDIGIMICSFSHHFLNVCTSVVSRSSLAHRSVVKDLDGHVWASLRNFGHKVSKQFWYTQIFTQKT